METVLKSPGSVTIDVEADDTRSLRRRLQRAESFTTAVLPGGAIVDESPDALVYHFHADCGWEVVQIDGRIQVRLAK